MQGEVAGHLAHTVPVVLHKRKVNGVNLSEYFSISSDFIK